MLGVAGARLAVQFGLGLQPTVASNVPRLDFTSDQHAANQQITMAFSRILLAAKKDLDAPTVSAARRKEKGPWGLTPHGPLALQQKK